MKPNSIYLDYNATTPVDPEVLDAMLPYFTEKFGNSISQTHNFGWEAQKAVEKAREQVAVFLNCEPREIYFTSGATESNNWAFRGLLDQLTLEKHRDEIHFLTSPIEHSSVLKCLQALEQLDPRLKIQQVKVAPRTGELDFADLQTKVTPATRLLSFMWANNEIGTLNPVDKLASIAHQGQAYLHSDATPAIGKIRIDLNRVGVDLLSFSGHKIYGPKGSGILFQRGRNPKVRIQPLLFGGGHENGQRSGTVNVPAMVGLGMACELSQKRFSENEVHDKSLQTHLWQQLRLAFPDCRLNGPDLGHRSYNSLNLCFHNYSIPASFVDIAVSKGAACVTGVTSFSAVLRAIGLSAEEAAQSIRISWGQGISLKDMDDTVLTLREQLKPLS